ncbi:MAG TPA: glycosyltransferase family 2 protein [Candidatus Paceibacterota bacterium]|nr:glycosyltransferase family 2 protein [Verrucomicrobiota bacterium]HSA09468.1 glycosyltransferase family 2 protein [Candidatus Paceibacterota bacterium]
MSLAQSPSGRPAPPLSVIILNYNGAPWIERCLSSLRAQTVFDQIEVILADNASSDDSERVARPIVESWPGGVFIQHGRNLGYCEGNNRAAAGARGQYLLFLNNDTWLEPHCLEHLLAEVQKTGAAAAAPLILNYEDDSFQSAGAFGFDVFGLASTRAPTAETREVLMPEGCAYLIRRTLFHELGGFDPEFFMFADEFDLSWRVWISGHRAIAAPSAGLHHRGAAQVNPAGGGATVEFRTSDTKRYYANRNSLLVLLKNAHGILLLMVPLQLGLLGLEAIVSLALVRRLSFVKRAYLDAVAGCWRLRAHIRAERQRIRRFRRRGDLWMLRFLRWRLNRWDELQRMRHFGPPKITPR